MELYRFYRSGADHHRHVHFSLGVDLCITPLGNHFGHALTKSNKLWVIIAGGLLLGFLVSVAEPDLHILAVQVEEVTSGLIPG